MTPPPLCAPEQVIQSLVNIVSNVCFGYAADKTSSYHEGLTGIVLLCLLCLVLTLFLIFWDAEHAYSKLNRPRAAYGFKTVAS